MKTFPVPERNLSRRKFIARGGLASLGVFLEPGALLKSVGMKQTPVYDVIIIGGSYAGLAAAMSLGRALRKVLVIDSGKPCNRSTPHSHNFVTQDGNTPAAIAAKIREELRTYETVRLLDGTVEAASKTTEGFEVRTSDGQLYKAVKLLLATGLKNQMPPIEGFAECWGISVLHCPYCHGYEVKGLPTAVLANGETAFQLGKLISNWTDQLRIFTNGPSVLTEEQRNKLSAHGIGIVETSIARIEHKDGYVRAIHLADGSTTPVAAIYARPASEQGSTLPQELGCDLTPEGFIRVDDFRRSTVPGVFAAGDNSSMMRSVAMAVAAGTAAGAFINHDLLDERF